MLVRRLDNRDCPLCGAAVGVGVKEEPTGWKVYRVCIAEEYPCPTAHVGMISREDISELDDVARLADELL